MPELTGQTAGTNSQQNKKKKISAAFTLLKVCVKRVGETEGNVLLQETQKCKTQDAFFV